MSASGAAPILLYDGGCKVCARIGGWVSAAGRGVGGAASVIARPVGEDPAALRALNPGLDIWGAYAVVHVIMPDGSMKVGGEAVAEVLRRLPSTRWAARCLTVEVLGVRPAQALLNVGYALLDDVRPLLGCKTCGRSRPWVRVLQRWVGWVRGSGGAAAAAAPLHFAPLPVVGQGGGGE